MATLALVSIFAAVQQPGGTAIAADDIATSTSAPQTASTLPAPDRAEAAAPSTTTPPPTSSTTTSTAEAPQEAPTTAPEASGSFADGFESEGSSWQPLTGTWAVVDGEMVQSDASGFDYINQLNAEVAAEFDLQVTMRATSPVLGGGVIVGQPAVGSRKGAYIVDFTSGGSFLRWGRYDPATGVYTYIGGLNLGTDPSVPHELRIEVRTDTTLVHLDDTYIGAFEPVGSGSVGLVTSESSVAFDDFEVNAA